MSANRRDGVNGRGHIGWGPRRELLSHGKTGIQARHYERSDYILPKLHALQVLEQWVLDEASPAKVVSIT